MKVVWSILVLFVAAGLVVWLQPPQGSRIDPAAQLEENAAIEQAVNETIAKRPEPAQPPEPVKKSESAADAARALAADLSTERANATGASTAPSATPSRAAVEFRDGLDRTIKHATISPGKFERNADGTLLADGRYVVRGAGSAEDPYVVSWDLVMSAMDTFAPRQSLTSIPQRVAMLDGKHVRIDGYLAFPLVAAESKQLIVTLNQWDGCCIGVPPTAYDAIEVTLGSAVSVQRRLHSIMFGTVEGVFRVEPYVMDQWLVGLYLLDDASLKLDL